MNVDNVGTSISAFERHPFRIDRYELGPIRKFFTYPEERLFAFAIAEHRAGKVRALYRSDQFECGKSLPGECIR